MEKRVIAYSEDSRGGLDNDYTLYDDGTIEHKYDVAHNIGASGYNKSLSLKVVDLNEDVKQRLLIVTKEADIELAKQLLGL